MPNQPGLESRRGHLYLAPLAFLAAAGLATPPSFAVCEVGNRPGSTLLFPYFEVDTTNSVGLTTLLSLNNEASTATMTRVVVWTDWAIPVLAFDVYLAPRDVQTMNVRDIINGFLPSTGQGADLSGFAGCDATPPTSPSLSSTQIQRLRAYLTGVAGPDDAQCAGEPYGDSVARGYITVDAVSSCHSLGIAASGGFASTTPRSPATYFTDTAIVKNVLWGDFFYVHPNDNFAQGVEAIALAGDEAGFPGPNVNTFYGRYHSFDGRDKRSPLPTIFSTRYLNGGIFDGGTDLIAWRDNRSTSVAKQPCGGRPSWHPLIASFITARDENTAMTLSLTNTNEFPLATQRVRISTLGAGPSSPFGRIQVGFFMPPSTPAGAWLLPVMSAQGRFSVDFNGIPIDTGCGQTP